MTHSLIARSIRGGFHSPANVVVGNAPAVGVLDLEGTIEQPPIRIFFPASVSDQAEKKGSGDGVLHRLFGTPAPRPANYFVDNRVSYFLEGFIHVALVRSHTRLFRFLVRPLVFIISLFLPVRYLKVPHTVRVTSRVGGDEDPRILYQPASDESPICSNGDDKARSGRRLIVLSHGLTGTGEEHAALCSAWAKRGYVVASVHHRDGSSNRVPMPDGTCKFYQHFPTGKDYDVDCRLDQVKVRAKEMIGVCEAILDGNIWRGNGGGLLKQVCEDVDPNRVVAAGFSYGAATSALAATMRPQLFASAILMDGWFHIDITSLGFETDFPPDAFKPEKIRNGEDEKDGERNGKEKIGGLGLPSLFINSAQFEGYAKLYGATKRLSAQVAKRTGQPSEMHILAGTKHQNFCDVVFWFPKFALRGVGKFMDIGETDAFVAYDRIVDLTTDFMKRF